MSTIYSAEFRCVDCGAVVDVRVADSLNANRLPEARAWVLSRTLFQHPCACGRTVTAIQPFLYVDFDRGLWVQVVPEDQRPAYHAREPEVVAAYRAAFDPVTGPRFIASLGSLVTPRLAYGYEELREKVVGGDAGLDDALVEALKLEILATHPELLRRGVMLLTLDAADAQALRLLAYSFSPGTPGEIIGDISVQRTMYDALAAQGRRARQLSRAVRGRVRQRAALPLRAAACSRRGAAGRERAQVTSVGSSSGSCMLLHACRHVQLDQRLQALP